VTFNHLAAALAYYVITARPTADHVTATKAKVVAGWSRLDDCSPMQSLDGKQQLVLLEDHSAKVERAGSGKGAKETAENWTFDEASNRYLITLGGQEKSFTIVQPDNSEVCILVMGSPTYADMTESWYGRTSEDLQNDAAEAER
jgi:hypothetical protein